MPPIVSTDWRRCIFPPNQLFLYFTTTKVIEKASNYKVLFNNVCRLAAAPLNCCKLRATRPASGHFSAALGRVAPISACVFSDLFYKSSKKPQWQIAQSVIGAKLVFWLQLILHASSR